MFLFGLTRLGELVTTMMGEVVEQFYIVIPVVLAAIGLLLGVTYVVRWAVRKFGGEDFDDWDSSTDWSDSDVEAARARFVEAKGN